MRNLGPSGFSVGAGQSKKPAISPMERLRAKFTEKWAAFTASYSMKRPPADRRKVVYPQKTRMDRKRRPARLQYDEAADADWLRDALEGRSIDQVTPHRKGRKKPSRQHGRTLRRYLKRWKIARTISWLQYQRRLLVRHERHAHLFEGFLHLACMMLCLKGF